MAEKTLKEMLTKYVPTEDYLGVLTTGIVSKTRVDKEKRILEVFARFPNLIKKEILYALEAEVAEAYSLAHFKIFPQYPAELFDEVCMDCPTLAVCLAVSSASSPTLSRAMAVLFSVVSAFAVWIFILFTAFPCARYSFSLCLTSFERLSTTFA